MTTAQSQLTLSTPNVAAAETNDNVGLQRTTTTLSQPTSSTPSITAAYSVGQSTLLQQQQRQQHQQKQQQQQQQGFMSSTGNYQLPNTSYSPASFPVWFPQNPDRMGSSSFGQQQ